MKGITVPKNLKFAISVIDVLKELGGSGTPSEVMDQVIEKLNISDKELERSSKTGRSYIQNQFYWARFRLLKTGFVDFSQKNVWTLTEKGLETNFHEHDDECEDEPDYKSQLINMLNSMPARGFERICQRLFRESGFSQVSVTKRQGDGDFDGHGAIQLNPFLSMDVVFRCIRSKKAVGVAQIEDFRRVMDTLERADRGLIATTGVFTPDAKKEARKHTISPIETVDGEKLVEIFGNLQLGMNPRVVYDIDLKFFDEFLK